MARIYEDNSQSIGNTPLVRLNRVTEGAEATVLGKVEGRNPAYSVKCRIGAGMIWDAEKRGVLRPGVEIIEPTSGNTGIALAFVCAARGYKLTLTMPETMSIERRRVLAALGASLILTPGAEGMKGAVARAEEIAASDPKRWFLPQQFKNPANPAIHEKTTGPGDLERHRRRRSTCSSRASAPAARSPASRATSRTRRGKKILSVAVEPKESPVISQKLAGQELKPGPHKIQGIGAGFIPDTLDLSLVDRVEQVDSAEAIEFARRLAREEGLPRRHLLRRGGRGRGAAGEAAGVRRQDDRGDPARPRGALPVDGALRGHRRVACRQSPWSPFREVEGRWPHPLCEGDSKPCRAGRHGLRRRLDTRGALLKTLPMEAGNG